MSTLDPVVQIGDWYYQVIYGQLWPVSAPGKPEQMVRLEPRLHSLLNFFLLNPNTLLAKDTLIEKVWPADEGTDAAVMRAVGALRKVLGDDVREPSYIATVSKKGYCWLAEISAVPMPVLPSIDVDTTNIATISVNAAVTARQQRWPWRFVCVTALAVLLGCASLAYVLATFTAAPLVKLPDTILPVSALSGQEYWPVLNTAQSHVVYQHQAPDSDTLNWSVQRLADLRVEQLPEQYLQLSEPYWQDDQHIVFRANTESQHCAFYRQQVLPEPQNPTMLWPCNQVMLQALARWQQQWLWLDKAADSDVLQLWSGTPGRSAALVRTLAHHYRQLEHMLVRNDRLYLLVQQTPNSTALLQLVLPDGDVQQLSVFPYRIEHFSWWDDSHLLLAPVRQQLQILDVKTGKTQNLGPLTRELTQATRYGSRVLATQFLDYTTDILSASVQSGALLLTPWHVSNRSERLIAVTKSHIAFVSERAGHSQIWLAQGNDSIQLSRLNEQQHVQQLLWHNDELLVLISSRLYRLSLENGALELYPLQATTPGRYSSCNSQLYWTALTEQGWGLFSEHENTIRQILPDVVDVRCAPDNSLVLQFAADVTLSQLSVSGQLQSLPVSIDWHQQDAEQWFVDDSGIYWLAADGSSVQIYRWQTATQHALAIPMTQRPLAIYSNGNGLGYVVRPRPHDTDIVWLQNRR